MYKVISFVSVLRYREQELASKDREITGLQKQIHSLEDELSGISKAREATIRENKRILDDLGIMTEDNQVNTNTSFSQCLYNVSVNQNLIKARLIFYTFSNFVDYCYEIR